jgi:hypothetical protein
MDSRFEKTATSDPPNAVPQSNVGPVAPVPAPWPEPVARIGVGLQWLVLLAALIWSGTASVQFLTEAAAREELAADIREDIQRASSPGAKDAATLPKLLQLQESTRSLIRSGSTFALMTTREIAHQKYCATIPDKCPDYNGAVGFGRGGKGSPWDFVMDFSSNSLMAAAMMCTALVGALSGMFLKKRADFWQLPLGLAAGFILWLALWGLSGILTTAGGNLNPFTSALLSLAAGLSTERVFRVVLDAFGKWTTRLGTSLETAGAKAPATGDP